MPQENLGAILYFAYQEASLEEGCGTDDWEDIGALEQTIWARLTESIDFEVSDTLREAYEAQG